MIRWALVMITMFQPTHKVENVTLMGVYDGPQDCQPHTVHVFGFSYHSPDRRVGSKAIAYEQCFEIDGNKSPQPQIEAIARRK